MSERILKALMQMFAIIARVDGINDNGRLIVQSFLKMTIFLFRNLLNRVRYNVYT